MEDNILHTITGKIGYSGGSPHPNPRMYYYLVTFKGHEYRHYSMEELDYMWTSLRKKLPGADWSDLRAYEEDSRKRMHLHVYMRVGRKPFFPKYQVPGWSVNFTEFPLEDIDKIRSYLNKHNQCIDEVRQLFINNYSYYNYAFI